MAYSNGRLPRSVLAPIAGGYLRKDAAAHWNAMNVESRRRFGIELLPMGSMSSYRTYPQQVYLWNTVPHAHDRNWVAFPGTSNHGLAIAVDLKTRQMRWVIDQIGHKYGFTKGCSDAKVEWWHIKFNPGCTGATWHGRDPGPKGHGARPSHAHLLRHLSSKERKWVEHLYHHRRLMHKEARTGRGRRWRKQRGWCRYFKHEIRVEMHVVQHRARHDRKGRRHGWSVAHRGERYQLLKDAYRNKLKGM